MLPFGCRRALSFEAIGGRGLGAFMICDVLLAGFVAA